MTWDPTHPPTSGAIVSAPLRDNFAALDTMLVAALAALANGQVLIKAAGPVVGGVPVGTDGYVLMLVSSVPTWQPAPESFHNPMTAAGDVIVGGAAGAPARLGAGSDGQYLSLAGGTPAWSPLPSNNPMTAAGDLIVGGASGAAGRLGVGGPGQVLGVASGSPAWVGGPDMIPAVRGLGGTYTAAQSTIALTADFVWLRNPTARTMVLRTGLSATLNLTTAGPALNGRDQAGNFGPNAWVYVYAIWNGTTLGVIASAALPATGPTLPSGYTHWAFLTALRVGGTANQWSLGGRVNAATVYHEYGASVLSGGNATAETAISLASYVPPAAVAPRWYALLGTEYTDTTANVTRYVSYKTVAGGAAVFAGVMISPAANVKTRVDAGVVLANVAQTMYYNWDAGTGTRAANLAVSGYVVANGDA